MDQPGLCDTFVRISRGVWHWMRRAQRVRNPSLQKRASPWGMALRETTLTDYVVLRLLEECAPAVSVFTFPERLEAQTGADLELWITDHHRWIGLRVQCKVLGPNGNFHELHYQRNGQYQTDDLIQAAQALPGCVPIYLLYVGPTSCGLRDWRCRCLWSSPWFPRCFPMTWGNWWLSAYQVKRVRPKADLGTLARHMVPWHCMVCCPWSGPITVDRIWETLRETVFAQDERQAEPVGKPPGYVRLAIAGELPEAADALGRLLEGRVMRHLAVLDLHRGE